MRVRQPLSEIPGTPDSRAAMAALTPDEVGAASVPYLRLMGHLVYAWLWARMARLSLGRQDEAFHRAKLATARFSLSSPM